ncbi:phenylalanine--tRNA ligase beta subunit-related protein [Desulfovibrio sp.]|uniref:B3/B4 domain-containing protein n=1 Tax=Desulfovibrio sp. TaxID=885 RepID=UPI0025BE9E8F|nr:phenylalanine--tRNA ligase beta subunit-related protein [Desulfovibrio sp.]
MQNLAPIVSIDPALAAIWPDTALGCVFWTASVLPQEPQLWQYFANHTLPRLAQMLEDTELAGMPQIGPSRRAFKAFGRDPGRVRISSEALYRRLRQGKDLYRINTAVDANNLVSLETGFSLGTYDLACLQGDLVLRLGREGEAYSGIGKDKLDLCRMPLLADGLGPFGCPCSDSQRAMIVENTSENTVPRQLLTVIYGFSGADSVSTAIPLAQKHFAAFSGAIITSANVVCP